MGMNFAVIGGDLRIIKLVQMLAKDGNTVYIYGLERADGLEHKNIIKCESISSVIENCEIIIGPIPFSNNGEEINMPFSDEKITVREIIHNANGRILIAGSISQEVYDMQKDEDEECSEIVDVMNREELAVLNTISTAEGTIEIMIANTDRVIHGAEVLILGFGRVAKVLANKLVGLSTKVTCAARNDENKAWIRSYGYQVTDINNLKSELMNYDIIINTVPSMILGKEKLKYIKNDCLLIDLASSPGGINREAAKEKNIKCIWALALPGKVAPVTTAEIIKDTIYNVIKEISKNGNI